MFKKNSYNITSVDRVAGIKTKATAAPAKTTPFNREAYMGNVAAVIKEYFGRKRIVDMQDD